MDKILNYADTPEGKAQSERLVRARFELGCNSAKEFVEKYSDNRFSYTQYQKYESGERLLSKKAAMLYATIFNINWEWLKNGDATPTIPLDIIHKIGFVQAGYWQEALQLPENEWEEVCYPMNDNLKDKHIFALGVRGESMNKIFPPQKTTLICCCIEDYPFEIENGDFVIAQRLSPDGKYEATVKRFQKIDDGTIILEAMSTDPRYTNIICSSQDNCEYQIIAVVIDYQMKLKKL